jgi:nucleoside-diphosphate-sugar epimerase
VKAFVTGGSGFIGSHLVEELVNRGYEVYCLIRKTSTIEWLERLNVHFVFGDCRDKASLKNGVRGMDYVFHLAAAINGPDWQYYYDVNTRGTQNLIEACLDQAPHLSKFVFVSSISAAGPNPQGKPLCESDECRPISDYGRSKLLAERIVLSFQDRLPVVIIRPSNVLGPRQKELFESIKLINRGIKPLVGTPRSETSLSDVRDVVRAIVAAAQQPQASGQTYFVTDGTTYAWKDIVEAVAEALGRRRFFVRVPYAVQYGAALASELQARIAGKTPWFTRKSIRATRKFSWLYDSSKIEKELGFKPERTMKAAVQRTVEWYRSQGKIGRHSKG